MINFMEEVMKRAVIGILQNQEQAARVVEHLNNQGFDYEAISVLFPDHGELKSISGKNVDKSGKPLGKRGTIVHEKESKGPEGSAIGGATGGIIGGTIGLLAGIGALSIPGLGPFIAAGPIMAALSGSALGGSAGLLAGYLIGLNIPEYVVKGYEGSLKAGNALIAIHCDNSNEVDLATKILKREGAENITSTQEKAATR